MQYPVLSLTQKQTYYNEWLLSGEPQPQFLKRKNLGPSTFKADGIRRGKPTGSEQPLCALLPVQIKPIETILPQVGLWVQFPSGTRLNFTTEVPAQYAGYLLASIEASSC